MANDKILSYFYYTGETSDGDFLEGEFAKPMSTLQAEFEAKRILRMNDGGHLDVWYSETDELACVIEI